MATDDDIPVLTDTIAGHRLDDPAGSNVDLDRLQAEICASSLTLAEEMLRDACREAEQVLLQRVMAHMRAELPAIVRGVLKEHLDRQG